MISFILTLKRFFTGLFKVFKKPIFKTLITTLLLILLSGTLFYHGQEGWSWLDSLYFAVVSLIPTGINTGLSPATDFGKVFTMFYLVVGVGVMLILLIKMGKALVDFDQELEEEPKERYSIKRLNQKKTPSK